MKWKCFLRTWISCPPSLHFFLPNQNAFDPLSLWTDLEQSKTFQWLPETKRKQFYLNFCVFYLHSCSRWHKCINSKLLVSASCKQIPSCQKWHGYWISWISFFEWWKYKLDRISFFEWWWYPLKIGYPSVNDWISFFEWCNSNRPWLPFTGFQRSVNVFAARPTIAACSL